MKTNNQKIAESFDFSAPGKDLDRGIERVIARELSEMVDYQSLQADVQATRCSIISSGISQFFAEGAD